MRLLAFARTAIWLACVGSLAVFLLPWLAAQSSFVSDAVYSLSDASAKVAVYLFGDKGAQWLTFRAVNDAANKFDEAFANVSAVSHLLTAVLVAIGATGARYAYQVDRRLNDRWYWVSKTEEGGRLLRLAIGDMAISGIQSFSKRRKNPGAVINGKMLRMADENGISDSENNGFNATDIVAGRKESGKIYFEWKYINGQIATGITQMDYSENGLSALRRMFSRRSPLLLSGKFMLDSSAGSGTISFYTKQAEAEAQFERDRSRLPPRMLDAAC